MADESLIKRGFFPPLVKMGFVLCVLGQRCQGILLWLARPRYQACNYRRFILFAKKKPSVHVGIPLFVLAGK